MNLTFKMMYWGPLLFKCEMSKQHVKQLKQIINVKNPHNTKLAGDIKDQHQLTISQMDKFKEITNSYIQAFGKAYQTYYNKKGKLFVDVVDIWTNFMKPGDFNPLHVHYGCEFSSVIFLDVPDKLIKEQKITFTPRFKFDATDCFIGQNGTNKNTQFFGELYEMAMYKRQEPTLNYTSLAPGYSDIVFYYRWD